MEFASHLIQSQHCRLLRWAETGISRASNMADENVEQQRRLLFWKGTRRKRLKSLQYVCYLLRYMLLQFYWGLYSFFFSRKYKSLPILLSTTKKVCCFLPGFLPVFCFLVDKFFSQTGTLFFGYGLFPHKSTSSDAILDRPPWFTQTQDINIMHELLMLQNKSNMRQKFGSRFRRLISLEFNSLNWIRHMNLALELKNNRNWNCPCVHTQVVPHGVVSTGCWGVVKERKALDLFVHSFNILFECPQISRSFITPASRHWHLNKVFDWLTDWSCSAGHRLTVWSFELD